MNKPPAAVATQAMSAATANSAALRCEILDGGALEEVSVDVEPRAVTGTVPGSLRGVEGNLAAQPIDCLRRRLGGVNASGVPGPGYSAGRVLGSHVAG